MVPNVPPILRADIGAYPNICGEDIYIYQGVIFSCDLMAMRSAPKLYRNGR